MCLGSGKDVCKRNDGEGGRLGFTVWKDLSTERSLATFLNQEISSLPRGGPKQSNLGFESTEYQSNGYLHSVGLF